MSSKRETIMAQIAAQLAGTTGVGTRIYRSLVEALTVDESPALVITPRQETVDEIGVSKVDCMLTVEVGVYARGAVPDSLADPAAVSAYGKLMADPTLGGLAIDTTDSGCSWEFEEADKQAVWVTQQFNIHYRRDRGSLT